MTLVCEKEDNLIGFLTGSSLKTGVGNPAKGQGKTANINHIYIQKEYRDHVLGSKLIDEFKK